MISQINMLDEQMRLEQIPRYVRRISYDETRPFVLGIHYARRMPCITDAFGLFEAGDLIGVVTYGVPASRPLCVGIAGESNSDHVLELNRLVLLPEYNGENRASFLVAHSLKMLPPRTFVVSYADTAWSHIGYVYQATNWLYTGMSQKRLDTYQPGGKHPREYGRENNHSDLYQTRSAKHRYVYLVGDKRQKKQMRKELRYQVKDAYPKGDEIRYDVDNPQIVEPIQILRGKAVKGKNQGG